MNNYCRHCGFEFKQRVKKCPNCDTSIIAKRYDIEKHFKIRKNEFICSMIISFLLIARTILLFFENRSEMLGVIGIFLTISLLLTTSAAKVQYNNSRLINFIFYGIFLIISLSIITLFFLKDSYGF